MKKYDSTSFQLRQLHWLNVIKERIHFKLLVIIFKCINGLAPLPLSTLLSMKSETNFTLETKHYFVSTAFGKRAFSYFTPHL